MTVQKLIATTGYVFFSVTKSRDRVKKVGPSMLVCFMHVKREKQERDRFLSKKRKNYRCCCLETVKDWNRPGQGIMGRIKSPQTFKWII